jgi:hypothetical protein
MSYDPVRGERGQVTPTDGSFRTRCNLSVERAGENYLRYAPTFAGSPPGFIADFNGDGKPDILSSDGTLNLGNGDGTFHRGVQLNGAVLAVADFNGDGKPDVYILANTFPVQTAILFGNGDGMFQAPVIVTGIVPLDVWAVDLNADGKADLLGLSNDGKQLLVYSKFSPPSMSASGTSTLTVSTTGPSALLVAPVSKRSRWLFYAVLLPMAGFVLMGADFGSRKKKLVGILLICLTISGLLFLAGCGSGSNSGGAAAATVPGALRREPTPSRYRDQQEPR